MILWRLVVTYVAKESLKDVAIGDNISLMQSIGIT